MKRVFIIGGGLAGLISAIQLARKGVFCTIAEKKSYPFHRVCGEYVSNEVLPFLEGIDLFPSQFELPRISQFQLSSIKGRNTVLPLDLGGFGISRYSFDHFLYQKAVALGVNFLLNTEIEDVTYADEKFRINLPSRAQEEADVVIGTFGKRSKLDKHLNRDFISRRSPYVAVKYHIATEHPENLISLHNFPGGYCGISRVENGIVNLCYLVHRDKLREHGTIQKMEEAVLYKNPLLKSIFKNSDFLFKKPETINEISFAPKEAVHNHILMAGDSAGMITPLCGNGMAMAIHAAKLVSELVTQFCFDRNFSRDQLERTYEQKWNKRFAKRLWMGRRIQGLFGSELASDLAINMALYIKPVAKTIIKNTHGDPF